MKKIFLLLLGAGALAFASCNPKNDKVKDADDLVKNEGNDDDTDADFKKASLNYCECLDEAFNDLDPRLKKLFAKTADTKDPAVSLANELKELDQDEYEAIASELKRFAANTEAKVCRKTMKKKSQIDIDDDVDGLRKILKVIEKNDGPEFCISALKHSINSKERRHKREQQNSE